MTPPTALQNVHCWPLDDLDLLHHVHWKAVERIRRSQAAAVDTIHQHQGIHPLHAVQLNAVVPHTPHPTVSRTPVVKSAIPPSLGHAWHSMKFQTTLRFEWDWPSASMESFHPPLWRHPMSQQKGSLPIQSQPPHIRLSNAPPHIQERECEDFLGRHPISTLP